MQLNWRPLERREVDHELLWFIVSIIGLGLAAVWLAIGLPWPVCWFYELTGRPCASCGATRSAIALFHGQLIGSCRWNPLAFSAYCGIAAFNAYAFAVLITGGRRLRVSFSTGEKRTIRAMVIVLILTNWAYLLGHSSMFNY
jgi:hypothetical protein